MKAEAVSRKPISSEEISILLSKINQEMNFPASKGRGRRGARNIKKSSKKE